MNIQVARLVLAIENRDKVNSWPQKSSYMPLSRSSRDDAIDAVLALANILCTEKEIAEIKSRLGVK